MSKTSLCLMTPPIADPAAFRPLLDAALSVGRIESVHLRVAVSAERDAQRFVQALAPVVQEKGAALIIDPPADLREVARWGADGVHISSPGFLADALQALRPDRIVGAGGLRSKDAAMQAGEDGVDYVMFGEPRADGSLPPPEQVIERCQWWAEVFTTPCVGYAATPEMVAPLAATGVEFVMLGDWIFSGAAAEVEARMKAAMAALKG